MTSGAGRWSVAGRRDVPALDDAPVDLDPALDRLDEVDLGQDLRVEVGEPTRLGEVLARPGRGHVEGPEVRRAVGVEAANDDPGARIGPAPPPTPSGQGDLVEGRDVVAILGQADDVAVGRWRSATARTSRRTGR